MPSRKTIQRDPMGRLQSEYEEENEEERTSTAMVS